MLLSGICMDHAKSAWTFVPDTDLSPFARSTPLLINILCDHCLHNLGFYILKRLTIKKWYIHKLDFMRFFFNYKSCHY